MAILMVFNVLNYIIGFIIILSVAIDRKALKTADYPLLLTFAMFFIFTGNVSQIENEGAFSAALRKAASLVG